MTVSVKRLSVRPQQHEELQLQPAVLPALQQLRVLGSGPARRESRPLRPVQPGEHLLHELSHTGDARGASPQYQAVLLCVPRPGLSSVCVCVAVSEQHPSSDRVLPEGQVPGRAEPGQSSGHEGRDRQGLRRAHQAAVVWEMQLRHAAPLQGRDAIRS